MFKKIKVGIVFLQVQEKSYSLKHLEWNTHVTLTLSSPWANCWSDHWPANVCGCWWPAQRVRRDTSALPPQSGQLNKPSQVQNPWEYVAKKNRVAANKNRQIKIFKLTTPIQLYLGGTEVGTEPHLPFAYCCTTPMFNTTLRFSLGANEKPSLHLFLLHLPPSWHLLVAGPASPNLRSFALHIANFRIAMLSVNTPA